MPFYGSPQPKVLSREYLESRVDALEHENSMLRAIVRVNALHHGVPTMEQVDDLFRALGISTN